jgi:hypothetical protein
MLNGRMVLVYLVLGVVAIVVNIFIWLFTTRIGLLVLGLFVIAVLVLVFRHVHEGKNSRSANSLTNNTIALNDNHQTQAHERPNDPTLNYIHRASDHLGKAGKLKTPRGKYRRIIQANDIITQGLADPSANHSMLRYYHDIKIKHHLEQGKFIEGPGSN